MATFKDFWKVRMHKEGAVERLKAIDQRYLDLLGEMEKKVDPTKWNMLLDEMDALGKEREELVAMTGPFKDQTDVI